MAKHIAVENTFETARDNTSLLVAEVLELPADQRTAFWLRDVRGLTYQELCRVLHVPLGTAASHVRRARARLREILWSHRADFEEFGVDLDFLSESLQEARRTNGHADSPHETRRAA